MSVGTLLRFCYTELLQDVDHHRLSFVFNLFLKIRRTSICQKIRNIQLLLRVDAWKSANLSTMHSIKSVKLRDSVRNEIRTLEKGIDAKDIIRDRSICP